MASHFHSNVATLAAQADPAKMASRSLQPAGGEAPSSLFIKFSGYKQKFMVRSSTHHTFIV